MPTGVYKRTEANRTGFKKGSENYGVKFGAWNKGKKTGIVPVGSFKKGNIPYNKGLKGYHHSGTFKVGHGRMGIGNWKGDEVGYWGLHEWVKKNLGRPNFCEHCRTTKAKRFEWANKSHEYKRELTDWIRLCTKCHRNYDLGKYIIDRIINGIKKYEDVKT